jgi:acetolactate synthase-1/3 small subunit
VVDIGPEHYTVEVTGDEGKMEAILNIFKPIGIKEIAKTGIIALFRNQVPKKS